MILPIIIEPNPLLHQPTQPITELTSELSTLMADMQETMKNAVGVGLAAPQIGQLISLCVIGYNDPEDPAYDVPFMTLINPRVTWKGQKKVPMVEACLSLPGLEGPVVRPDRIRVKARNEHFEEITIEAEGILARVLQHEIDHLNGIMFTSYISNKKQMKKWITPDYPRI